MAIKGGLKSTGNLDGGGDDCEDEDDWWREAEGAATSVIMVAATGVGAGAGAGEGDQGKKPLRGDIAGGDVDLVVVVVVMGRTMNTC